MPHSVVVKCLTRNLGSVIYTHCGTEANVKAIIDKARVAFPQLKNICKNIWKSKSPFSVKQDQDFHYKCQGCSSLQSRDICIGPQ